MPPKIYTSRDKERLTNQTNFAELNVNTKVLYCYYTGLDIKCHNKINDKRLIKIGVSDNLHERFYNSIHHSSPLGVYMCGLVVIKPNASIFQVEKAFKKYITEKENIPRLKSTTRQTRVSNEWIFTDITTIQTLIKDFYDIHTKDYFNSFTINQLTNKRYPAIFLYKFDNTPYPCNPETYTLKNNELD